MKHGRMEIKMENKFIIKCFSKTNNLKFKKKSNKKEGKEKSKCICQIR